LREQKWSGLRLAGDQLMTTTTTILQMIPQLPGSYDGVGDYALTLAKGLSAGYGVRTMFAVAQETKVTSIDDFPILSGLKSATHLDSSQIKFDHMILHYANYGYRKRGVPFRLLSILRELRQDGGGLLTIFHELYAPAAPPWKSAFWLRPFQIQIARSVARLSDACIVSNEVALEQLRGLVTNVRASIHPVISNFGEPALSPDQIAKRDPHRWAICGGTVLVERALRSFRSIVNRIPRHFFPRTLFVLGGNENPAVRSLLVDLAIQFDYRPRITAAEASQILSTCSFGWLDYFHRPDVQTSTVFKSTAFAAYCAHGIIPVFPHRGSPISLRGNSLLDPFFIDSNHCDLPSSVDRARVATEFYEWYQRCACSKVLVLAIAAVLKNSPAR
jgi:hypothetical protein